MRKISDKSVKLLLNYSYLFWFCINNTSNAFNMLRRQLTE